MNNQRMIEKIKKLFALAANDSAVGNESENAMRMANKLLEKHAIDMLDLADNDKVSCTFCSDQNTKWVRVIYSSICSLYDCCFFVDKSWDKPKFMIIGKESNRITASIVIDHLVSQIKSEKGKLNDFKLGAATSIYHMCNDIIKERKSSLSEILPGTGLIPLDLIKQNELLNKEWIDKNVGKLSPLKSSRSKVSQDGLDYGKGMNVGARVSQQHRALS